MTGVEQLDLEYQGRIRRDQLAGTVATISLGRWDHQAPFGPDRHLLQRAAPAADHTVQAKPLGLRALIEDRAVGQSSNVIHLNLIIRARLVTTAGCQFREQDSIGQLAYSFRGFFFG